MDYVRFGRTGLKVSRLCLGTMTFGLQCDEPSSFVRCHCLAFRSHGNIFGLGRRRMMQDPHRQEQRWEKHQSNEHWH